jgi:hypothetical protein
MQKQIPLTYSIAAVLLALICAPLAANASPMQSCYAMSNTKASGGCLNGMSNDTWNAIVNNTTLTFSQKNTLLPGAITANHTVSNMTIATNIAAYNQGFMIGKHEGKMGGTPDATCDQGGVLGGPSPIPFPACNYYIKGFFDGWYTSCPKSVFSQDYNYTLCRG